MALPVQDEITTMDYPSRGLPYVDVPAKDGIVTQTMDYTSRGLPFVTNDDFTGGEEVTIIPLRTLMGIGV